MKSGFLTVNLGVPGVSRVVKGRTGVFLCRRRLWTIDLHAGGVPARVVVGGMPHVEGRTMREKRHTLMTKMDHIRKMLLLEPRGVSMPEREYHL
jgi:hypothetical protein